MRRTLKPFVFSQDDFLDDREEYGKERFVIIGMAEGQVLLKHEQDHYFKQNARADEPRGC